MQHITYFENNTTAIITFSRPKSLNALNSEVFLELNQILDKMELSNNLKAAILTGEGKAFIAGADISEMHGKTKDEAQSFSKIGQNTLLRIENMPIPFIGAINGFALGGGLEVALACDFLLASNQAKFSAPEVNLGLIPGFGGTQRLTRTIGLNNARFYLLTAHMFDAYEAQRMGLVQQVFAADDLMNEALKSAELMASKGSSAIKSLKQLINNSIDSDIITGCKRERESFGKCFEQEAQEGMQAFLEKRQANW